MKSILYNSMKRFLIVLLVGLFLYCMNVRIEHVISLFFELLTLLEISYWIPNIPKLVYTIIFTLILAGISITLLYFCGLQSEITTYVGVLLMISFFSLAFTHIKKR